VVFVIFTDAPLNYYTMKYLLCILPLCFLTQTFAQYSDAQLDKIITTYPNEKILLESSVMLQDGYYIAAEKLVDKLLQSDASNCNYNYRKGIILSDAHSNYAGAIVYLEKAATSVDKNYDMFSGSEKDAGIEVFYQLGRCYHRTGNFTKAKEQYNRFLAEAGRKTELTAAADLGLQQIALAEKLQEYPKKNVNVVNLGTVINTPFPEYSPVVSFDGSALYFTSRREWAEGQTPDFKDPQYDFYPEDIYVSYRDFDDSWMEPSRLEFCKADQNEASLSVSPDERRIYVYQDVVGNGDVFYSDFSTNRFKNIEAFNNKDVNTDFWETHCVVTPDGRNMYFASERPEGFGGRDIYRIVKLPDGTWSKAFNLGPTINSAFDEDAPFMAADNKTLYFASNGPRSIGGFDVLFSVIDNDNNWSEPINPGYPMNSPQDDLFYTETLDGRRGYITSMRGDSKGEKDIYEVQNDYLNVNRGAILKGKVIVLNNRPMPEDVTITIACSDCSEQHDRTVYPRSRDGAFMMTLDPCRSYEIIFHHDNGGKEFYRESFSTDCLKEKEELYREVFLDADLMTIVQPKDTTPPVVVPVDTTPVAAAGKFEPLAFRHTFGYNKNKLMVTEGQLKSFLKQVDSQLKSGREGMVIEIWSSASTVPTAAFRDNQELSETRANNLKKLLDAHFAKTAYAKKVQVKVVSAVVSGPAFGSDANNKEKYTPYQFVELKTN